MKLFLILVFLYFFYKIIISIFSIKKHDISKDENVIDVDYEEVE